MSNYFLLCITFIFLVWCCGCGYGRGPDPLLPSPLREKRTLPELVRQLKPSVVSIYVYDQKNQYLEGGSGFFISHDLVVSSRHGKLSFLLINIHNYFFQQLSRRHIL